MCAYMYVRMYSAHSHMHIYLKAEYKDISKRVVLIQLFSLYQPVLISKTNSLYFVYFF